MYLYRILLFDDAERDTIIRALEGHEYAISLPDPRAKRNVRGGEDRIYPVRTMLGRLRAEEPLERKALNTLLETLTSLLGRWQDEARPEFWTDMGTPPPDAAGLVQVRLSQIGRAQDALRIVREAINYVGEQAPTRAERMAEES